MPFLVNLWTSKVTKLKVWTRLIFAGIITIILKNLSNMLPGISFTYCAFMFSIVLEHCYQNDPVTLVIKIIRIVEYSTGVIYNIFCHAVCTITVYYYIRVYQCVLRVNVCWIYWYLFSITTWYSGMPSQYFTT